MTSATSEYRVVGPPGCGKTTWVARQARHAVEKHGPTGVLICSLTRAAAAEAAGRETGVDRSQVGTLHSLCYHALGRPKIVEKTHVDDWNSEHRSYPLTPEGDDLDGDRRGGIKRGDQLRAAMDLYRARMTPRELWPSNVRAFEIAWSTFKAEAGLSDFADLIEGGIERLPFAPGQPIVILADEAQDLSRLEVSLLRRWMGHAEQVVLIGDADQAVYHWRGADQRILSSGDIPPENWRVLSQSYRVPRAVHECAMEVIRRSGSREEVDYLPTEEPGEVLRKTWGYQTFRAYLELVDEALSEGRTVMVLASCEYMLAPIIKALRAEGIPYHNPYCGRWSPLRPGRGVGMADRLVAFAKASPAPWEFRRPEPWTLGDLKAWATCLRSGDVLVRGAKRRLELIPEEDEYQLAGDLLNEIFVPEALEPIARGDVAWLVDHMVATRQRSAQYPARIFERLGLDGLEAEPRVVVGTIHSVKGGEADDVILFPDLSPSGFQASRRPGWEHRDAVWRMFYVAMTRARRRLILGGPSGGYHVNI